MTETFLAGGAPIRMNVYEPHHYRHSPFAAKRPAIVLLHGSHGDAGYWLDRLAPRLTAMGLSLFAPHYFDRTQTRRADLAKMTDGRHVPLWLDTIGTAIDTIAARPEVDAARLALIGISLGGFLALGHAADRSASADPAVRSAIRCLVDVSGGLIEPYASRATAAFPPTLILHGLADTIVPISHAHALDGRLTQLSVPHQKLLLPNEGHWFSTAAQLQLVLAVNDFLRHNL